MASKENPSSNEPNKKKLDPKAIGPGDFENVVNELRDVLSNLNGHASSEQPPVVEPIFEEENILKAKPALNTPNEMGPEQLGEAAFRQAEKSQEEDGADSDFWKGNVLGWPAAPASKAPTPAPAPQREEPEEFDELSEKLGEPPAQKNNRSFSEPTAQFPFPPAPLEKEWTDNTTDDLPQIFPTSKQEDPFAQGLSLPPPPMSPLDREDEQEMEEPFLEKFEQTPRRFTPQQEEEPAMDEPLISPVRKEFFVPIPGTINKQEPPALSSPQHEDPIMGLNSRDPKSSKVIQIACVFPENYEADSEIFINALRVAAGKASSPKDVQTVFSKVWFSTEIDINAWKKSASISGADFLFVLTQKVNKDLFRDLAKLGHKDEVRARVVFIEQIKMRTLYADLLADISRGAS